MQNHRKTHLQWIEREIHANGAIHQRIAWLVAETD